MRENGRQQHTLSRLAALALLTVFALSTLLVLLTGASAYRRLLERGRESFAQRSLTQYIATRIRQGDAAPVLEDFYGLQALRWEDGEGGVTRLYCYDGSLWELYASGEIDLKPDAGERVLPLAKMTVTLEDGLFRGKLTEETGRVSEILLTLPAERGRQP